MLEDRLRDMFAAEAERAPAMEDPASRAIRSGRRIRRRNAATASASAAAALVVTVAGVVSLGGLQTGQDNHRGTPVAPFDVTAEPIQPNVQTAPPVVASIHPRTGAVGLDLRSGNQLWTHDGKRLALTDVGDVTRIYRVPGGWVYGGAEQVRIMHPDGTSTTLITGDRWVISPDGSRIAFVIGERLHVARIDESGIVVHASAPVPTGTEPVVFADDQIVIAGPSSSGYDLLDPDNPTAPAWNRDVVGVFGRHGSGLAGLVRLPGSAQPCLAVLEASPGLPVSRVGTCGGEFSDASKARLSPNGAWLAVAEPDGLSIINIARTTSGHPGSTPCPVRSSVAPAWLGTMIIAADDRGLIRCGTNGRLEVMQPPAGIQAGWQLVPALEFAATPPATKRAGPTTAA